MEEWDFLVCFLWLAQHSFLYHSGPPAQRWPSGLGPPTSTINQHLKLRVLKEFINKVRFKVKMLIEFQGFLFFNLVFMS